MEEILFYKGDVGRRALQLAISHQVLVHIIHTEQYLNQLLIIKLEIWRRGKDWSLHLSLLATVNDGCYIWSRKMVKRINIRTERLSWREVINNGNYTGVISLDVVSWSLLLGWHADKNLNWFTITVVWKYLVNSTKPSQILYELICKMNFSSKLIINYVVTRLYLKKIACLLTEDCLPAHRRLINDWWSTNTWLQFHPFLSS